MQSKSRLFVGALLLTFAFYGCADTTSEEGSGSASVAATVAGLSADDVTAIQITVSGPNISPDIVSDLTKDPGTGEWSGVISGIPAGTDRTFLAEASNASAEVIYSGSATGVTIIDGQKVAVNLFLQQTAPPDPFTNTVPIFESLVVSSAEVAPSDDVTLNVTVNDPDPGDTLTLLWTATGGTYDVTDAQSVVWTAPATEGLYALTVSATDSTGSTSTLTASIDVQISYGSGSASVEVDFNTWPEIQNLVPTPTRIDVGETTQLSLAAVDPDGDPLTYAWSADCTGTFSDAAIEDPTFTLDADHGSAPCALTVTIDDGHGGSNSASVNIATGPPVSTSLPQEGCPGADSDPSCVDALVDVGAVSGDQGGGTDTIAVDAFDDEQWIRFTVTEDDGFALEYASATVTLTSPIGTDFDLYAYCASCASSLADSSTIRSQTGHDDVINVRTDDELGTDDTFDVIVEVRYVSANACAQWTLTIQGDTTVGEATCGVGGGVGVGEIVISELMPNPEAAPDVVGEYIELYNPTAGVVDLSGWEFEVNGAVRAIFPAGIAINPGEYQVLIGDASPAVNGGIENVSFDGFTLSLPNTSTTTLVLRDSNGVLIDTVTYDDGWPFAPGVAAELSNAYLDANGNDDPLHWCASTVPYGTDYSSYGFGTDLGTPGAPNICP